MIHGDALEVLPHIPAGVVDAVVTDPPYGIGFAGKATKHTRQDGIGYESHEDTEENIVNGVVPIVKVCIERFPRVLVTPGCKCLFMYPRASAIGTVYCPSGAGRSPWGFQCCYPILYYGKDPWNQTRPNSFSSTEPSEENGHPCPKPIGWMRWMVRRATLKGQTILDPFAGSGTTGVAAILEGRRCILIEKEAKYVEIIRRRIDEALCVNRENLFREVAASNLFEVAA